MGDTGKVQGPRSGGEGRGTGAGCGERGFHSVCTAGVGLHLRVPRLRTGRPPPGEADTSRPHSKPLPSATAGEVGPRRPLPGTSARV